MTKQDFFTREVVVKIKDLKTIGYPIVRLKVKCDYNPSRPSRYPECEDGYATIDILSITSEDDISGLLDDAIYEEIYDTALYEVEDKMRDEEYGIPEGKFIHVEADE